MSRLQELIQRLCPEGVEYKALGDIATITRGGNFQKKDYVEQGFPCIHYGQIYTKYNLFVTETISHISNEKAEQQKKAEPGDIIMAVTSENIEDVCKCIAWLGDSKVAVSGHAAIIHHSLNPKFLTYFLSSSLFYKQKLSMVQGTKVIEVSPEKLKKITLPVPPLEVQQEIVRILDQFTQLTAELAESLDAECAARKKQYEYYRDYVLTEQSETLVYTIGELCKVSRGKVISKDYIRDNPGIYPVYSSQTESDGVLGLINSYEYDGEYLTWTTDGANAGTVFYRKGKFSITNVCGLLTPNRELVLPKYLYYALGRVTGNYVSRGMGNPKLMSNVMSSIKLLVPSLEAQNSIVAILDRFDALCNDLTSGLPAEIAARQKQYEYYRDKLLTFPQRKEADA